MFGKMSESDPVLPAVLAASAARGSLGCQTLFLRLRTEEAAVFQFAQDTRVVDRIPEPVDQALWVLAVARSNICHSILQEFLAKQTRLVTANLTHGE